MCPQLRSSILILLSLQITLFLISGSVLAQGAPGGISATLSGLGAGDGGTVLAELPFRFDVRYTGLPDWSIKAFINGFRIYSPDGATWQPIICDSFSIGWPARFDFLPFHVYYQNVTGSGADSFAVSAIASNSPGLDNGFDGEVWYVGTKTFATDVGKTICLDSAWVGATNAWLWSLDGGGSYAPSWSGPYCYLIESPPTWNPGDDHKMHFPQLPDPDGWDCDIAHLGANIALADDWQCSETGWVKAIHWWGAWWQGIEGTLDTLYIAIHKDTVGVWGVPEPGRILWQAGLADVQATLIPDQGPQNWFQPSTGHSDQYDNQASYQFGIFLDSADWFWQEEGTIYWLAMSTDVDGPGDSALGWTSSQNHWRSPAIWGQFADDWYPWPPLAEPPDWQVPLDLAFVITDTVGGGCCIPPLRGNVDYDAGDAIDISDLVYLVDHMFSGGPPPPCLAEADIDCSGGLDISDLVFVVDYMFSQGPAPCRCDCADCP